MHEYDEIPNETIPYSLTELGERVARDLESAELPALCGEAHRECDCAEGR